MKLKICSYLESLLAEYPQLSESLSITMVKLSQADDFASNLFLVFSRHGIISPFVDLVDTKEEKLSCRVLEPC